MSDKELIKQEIERRIESINSCPFRNSELGSEKFSEGELYAYKQILQFIDSLPEESISDEEIEALNDVRHLNPGLDSLYWKLKKL